MEYRFEHEPKRFFEYFEELSRIPRGSGNEKGAGDFIADFAENHGISWERDAAGNVKLTLPASEGKENRPVLGIQAHLDMVTVADPGTKHDFRKDPLDLYEEDGYIKARGTTLGSDDGSGVAMILAVLDEGCEHGPLRAFFTTGEEAGLLGARAMDPVWLDCDCMVGLDCSSSRRIIVSSAGMSTVIFRRKKENVSAGEAFETAEKVRAYRISVGGMKGGHSGHMIHTDTANAVKVLGEFAAAVTEKTGGKMADFTCDNPMNAIPSKASCLLVLPESRCECLAQTAGILKEAYRHTEPSLEFVMEEEKMPEQVLAKECSEIFLKFVRLVRSGAYMLADDRFSRADCSANLASVDMSGGDIVIGLSMRSNSEYFHDQIIRTETETAELCGFEAAPGDRYGSWEYDPDSEFRELVADQFRKVKGFEPEVKQIHAGLEEGIFDQKAKQNGRRVQMVNVGCTTIAMHSPSEKLEIASVSPTYELLKAVMKEV